MKKRRLKRILVFAFAVVFSLSLPLFVFAESYQVTANNVAYRYSAAYGIDSQSSYMPISGAPGTKLFTWINPNTSMPAFDRFSFYLRFPDVVPVGMTCHVTMSFWIQFTNSSDQIIQVNSGSFNFQYGAALYENGATYWRQDFVNTGGTVAHSLGSTIPCPGVNWAGTNYSYFTLTFDFENNVDVSNMLGIYLYSTTGLSAQSCMVVLDYCNWQYTTPAPDPGPDPDPEPDNSSGINIDVNIDVGEPTQPEIANGLGEANNNMEVQEEAALDNLNSAMAGVDLAFDNIFTGTLGTSLSWFTGKLQDFYSGVGISSIVDIALFCGAILVILGLAGYARAAIARASRSRGDGDNS